MRPHTLKLDFSSCVDNCGGCVDMYARFEAECRAARPMLPAVSCVTTIVDGATRDLRIDEVASLANVLEASAVTLLANVRELQSRINRLMGETA